VIGTDAKEACKKINSKLAIVDREYVKKELSNKLDGLMRKLYIYFIGFESILDWSDFGGKQISSSMWDIGFPKRYSTPGSQVVLSTVSAKLTNTDPRQKIDGAICQKYEGKHLK
jgi:hypothetical protein